LVSDTKKSRKDFCFLWLKIFDDFAIVPSLVGANVLDFGRRSDCNGSVTAEDFHLASPFKNETRHLPKKDIIKISHSFYH
jgi:hypothetical protein